MGLQSLHLPLQLMTMTLNGILATDDPGIDFGPHANVYSTDLAKPFFFCNDKAKTSKLSPTEKLQVKPKRKATMAVT